MNTPVVATPSHAVGPWHKAPPQVALNIVAVIVGGLIVDAQFGWAGQVIAVVWAWLVFGWLLKVGRSLERKMLVFCTLIATLGEVFLSLVWGLYDYQFSNIPLFVPPGHALLMTLGVVLARPLPSSLIRGVTILGVAWAAYALLRGSDQLGAVLFLLYALCIAIARSTETRKLYATMFVLALLMELLGTALGNWTWRSIVPGWGLTQANPPFSAGAFYCVLDMLVLVGLRAAELKLSANAEKSTHL